MSTELSQALTIMASNTEVVEEAIEEFGEEAETLEHFHERMKVFIETELEQVAIETVKYKLNVTDEYTIDDDFNVFEMIMVGLEYCEDLGVLETDYKKLHAAWFSEGEFVSALRNIVDEVYKTIEFH